jgi:DNA modification methylase
VLSFPPHPVNDYIRKFGITCEDTVLDPFCGTGTTVAECKKLGVDYVGVEANPVACFAARVKTDWSPDPHGLIEHACKIAAEAQQSIEESGYADDPVLIFEDQTQGSLFSLHKESYDLLLTNSISPIPLHKTLALLSSIYSNRDDRFYDHERLALAKAIVSPISNLQFGPEVGVGPQKGDAPVVSAWLDNIRCMAWDLEVVAKTRQGSGTIIGADSRNIATLLAPCSINAVITSPPYPNEKDYTRTTRLESVLLGFIKSKPDLQALKRGMVKSNTRGVYKTDTDDSWVEEHPEVQRIAAQIEARRVDLGKTSGFERLYSRVTKLYFGGMARHLADLRSVLKPGAQLAYVVGDQASYLRVMIRTGELLADIAKSLGYEVIGIDLFRTRLATATKEQLREEVVLLKWNGAKG